MARRRTTSFRRGGVGPNYVWARLVDPDNQITVKTLMATASSATGIDLTIRRNRGFVHTASDQTVATEVWGGVLGMMVVSAHAASAGAASIPGPATDPDADWLVWQGFHGIFQFKTAVGFVADRGGPFWQFDSKAMRKLSAEESLVIMAEPYPGSQGFNVSLYLSSLASLRGRS